MQNSNEEIEMNSDAAWDMWLSQAESVPESKLEKSIDEQFNENRKTIEELESAGAAENVISIAEQSNFALYNAAKGTESENTEREIASGIKRNRFAGLIALRAYIKSAIESVQTSVRSAYEFIVTPILKIEQRIALADVKTYQKYIAKTEEKFAKEKDKIDKKALTRLRRFNLRNMHKKLPTYDTNNLPYKPREQEKINKYEKDIYDAKQRLSCAQQKADVLARRLSPRREVSKSKHTATENHCTEKTEISQEKNSGIKGEHENRRSEQKKGQRLTEAQYEAIKSQHLSDGQFKTAVMLVKKFPDLGLENKLTNDIPGNKYVYIAKVYSELKDIVEFDKIRDLKLPEVSALALGLENHAVTKEEAAAVVEYYRNKAVQKGGLHQEYKESCTENLETKTEFEHADNNSEEKNLDEDMKDAINTVQEKRDHPEVRRAMAVKAVNEIERNLEEGKQIDFEASGNAFRAVKAADDTVKFYKYNFENSDFEQISRLQAINQFMKEPKEIKKAIDAQFVTQKPETR